MVMCVHIFVMLVARSFEGARESLGIARSLVVEY